MSIIEKLTEGVVRRDVQKEGAAILDKWDKTGLLEGINSEHTRNNMACLLENQAKELLREASTMAAGDVEGFAAVAFPIVRRVFGGLIANELVSVQPMSLPSGLIFFLDFTHGTTRLNTTSGTSVYGGGKVGSEITGGVSLAGGEAEQSFYSLNNGYASPTGSVAISITAIESGTVGDGSNLTLDRLCQFDPDLSGSTVAVGTLTTSDLTQFNKKDFITVKLEITGGDDIDSSNYRQIRRLTRMSGAVGDDTSLVVLEDINSNGAAATADYLNNTIESASFVITDNFVDGALGGVVGAATWGLENNNAIPEINIKVDAVSVTAMTKKLKAIWTPELQQDINAYHNLDAEVELTSLLSEQIALEIDQEVLEDLVKGSTAATYYWSRKPGKFVNRETGADITNNGANLPDFTGTVSEWYETLLETVNDVSAQIHRKTLRGGANFIVVSPEVANILEFTSGFRADTTADENRGTAGAVKVGQLSKKMDIYVDPYFVRNVVLVGRKGNSFLESGYVYAPYVPLQVTPTIFDPDNFTPRKGVMTRYSKKMVRPDMYGLVVVEDLLG
tara:strand:+ start:457 stop:2139 length:1683 start_codon:yes stop_codon:yes gene_type:complete